MEKRGMVESTLMKWILTLFGLSALIIALVAIKGDIGNVVDAIVDVFRFGGTG